MAKHVGIRAARIEPGSTADPLGFWARGVAQPGSALRSGRRGPQFKSGHPDAHASSKRARGRPWFPPRLGHADRLPASILARAVFEAVVFDVDFTLARPGPDLGPTGYRELGLRYGLSLDPARYDEARAVAFDEVTQHPELDHDDEIWVLFTERIIQGMGGVGETHAAAVEMERRWTHSARFELYDDALPTLEAISALGLKIGLLSNSSRDLGEFVAHHGVAADAVLTSASHGKSKPHRTIFRAILDLLEVDPGAALMVGDTLHDDVEGARAVGMRAVLLDRDGRYPGVADRLHDLRGLAALLRPL
jgi:putative hydrolase of the HAD superfamily